MKISRLILVGLFCIAMLPLASAYGQEIQQGGILNYEAGIQNTLPSDATGPGIIHEIRTTGVIVSVNHAPVFDNVAVGNTCARHETKDEFGNPCAPIMERRMIGYSYVGATFDDRRCLQGSFRQENQSICLATYLRGVSTRKAYPGQEFEIIVRRIFYPADLK